MNRKSDIVRLAAAVGLALLLCIGVIFVVFRILDWEKEPVSEVVRSTTGASYVELATGTTEYELAGPDSGQVVVLISGASVPYYIYDGTFEALVNAGFYVVRYNYFGRGFSDRPLTRYTGELYVQQLAQLIDSLGLAQPVDLIGLSMGGWVSAAFVDGHAGAVRKLVLIDPAYRSYAPPSYPEWMMHLIFVFAQQNETAESQATDFLKPELFPDWVERYKIQMGYSGFRHSRISTWFNFGTEDHQSRFQKLKGLGKPILLVWGEHDATIPFVESRIVVDITGAEFVPVPDAAHLPHLEQPEMVNPVIVEFLSR